MSDSPTDKKPQPFTFRASTRKQSLPPDKAKRQGEITSLAFLHLGGRDGAMAFLNTIDPELDGRPLDIAIASEEGCQRVRDLILKRASAGTGRG